MNRKDTKGAEPKVCLEIHVAIMRSAILQTKELSKLVEFTLVGVITTGKLLLFYFSDLLGIGAA